MTVPTCSFLPFTKLIKVAWSIFLLGRNEQSLLILLNKTTIERDFEIFCSEATLFFNVIMEFLLIFKKTCPYTFFDSPSIMKYVFIMGSVAQSISWLILVLLPSFLWLHLTYRQQSKEYCSTMEMAMKSHFLEKL